MGARPFLVLLVAAACAVPPETPVTDGPDPRYWRYDRILDTLESWRREHPAILHLEDIGRGHSGEGIRAARISGRPHGADPAPVLLLHAAQHANEANGTGAIMLMMKRLLDGYGRDSEVTAIVDGLEIWFVPVVNVDGHRRVFSGAPGWEDWRKNGREPHGVDLNRNWDHRWEDDPSSDPASRNYKGPEPISEPETRALRDFVLRHRPLIVVDYHSPGKITPPNRIFWPWLWRETNELGPDADAYRAIAKDLAAATETEEDGVFYDGDGYGFDTLPKEQNWIYRETGACVLLVEISKRFWWTGPIVDTIADRVARGSRRLLERALRGPGLEVRVTDATTGHPLEAEIVVEEHHDPRIGPRTTDPENGIHRRLLNPGPVSVTMSAAGREPVARKVEIAESGWTALRFSLSD